MRIGIDLHVLNGKSQGSKSYLKHLTRNLLASDMDSQFYLYGDPTVLNSHYGCFANSVIKPFRFSNNVARILINEPLLCLRDRIDIIHTQYNMSPFVFGKAKRIVTIHDILFEDFPQYFTKPFVLRSKLFIRQAAYMADAIITVSQYCKQFIISKYRIPESKIFVTYHGIDKGKQQQGSANANDVLTKYNIVKPFFLMVGRLEPRKNHLSVIKAFKALSQDAHFPYRLVIIGERDFGFNEIINEIYKNNNVILIENMYADIELFACYQECSALIYPSFAEGFGIPIIEAMAFGRPVITSNVTSMPEVAGDAALYVDPNRWEDILDKIKLLASNENLISDLSKKSASRAKVFRWEKTAEETLHVYNHVLGN